MKRQENQNRQGNDSPSHDIPDIEILDLEDDGSSAEDDISDEDSDMEDLPEEQKRGLGSHHIMHIIFLLSIVGFFAAIFIKFSNWGTYINPDDYTVDESKLKGDVLDSILPLLTGTENAPNDDGVTTILAFGNYPFADDRDSKDGLANLIAEKADAVVYNCAVSDSCLSSQLPYFDASYNALDAYSFYWLVTLATSGVNKHYYTDAAKALGEETPPEAQEVYDTLTTLDLNTVDVAVIMYDASDYLMGRDMYNDENRTDVTSFTGAMEAGIELLQQNYPNMRIIVMSPTYAYALGYNGEYVSSDMFTYGANVDVLSTYVIRQSASASSRGVSFVDNLYGTITEDNAEDYLIDHIHLNAEGRKLVADRFLYALNYYNREEE